MIQAKRKIKAANRGRQEDGSPNPIDIHVGRWIQLLSFMTICPKRRLI